MEYRILGRTGLKVGAIALGCEGFADKTAEEVRADFDFAIRNGINFLDLYASNPELRSNIGAALAGRREKFVIQGHLCSVWEEGQYLRTRDPEKSLAAFEDMLARLGTDYVEIGMIHYVDACDEFRAIMDGPFIEYVRELLTAGKIGHIGLSTHNPEVALLACDEPEIEVIMFSLNPAFDMMPASEDLEDLFGDYENVAGDGIEPVRARLYARAEEKDVALTVMKGYAGGRLLSADASPFGVALTPVQCIHYALTRPAVASVMVGVETVEQLEEALAYEGATAAERDYASVLAGAPKHAYMGQCTYCGHCAPCTVGINIALSNKFADLAEMAGAVPASVAAHYKAMDVTAGACIACGDCEPRCPFDVPIIERMEKTEELFGC